ncbi:consortin [Rhinoraja longicauda]
MDEGELVKVEVGTADNVCNECVGNSTSVISDENKNQICEAQLVSSSTDEIMGGQEQDLINNNEEDCERTDFEITQTDSMEADCNVKTEILNAITSLNTKLSVEKEKTCDSEIHIVLKTIPSDGISKSPIIVTCKESDELEVNCQQVDREELLQALLNCIQKATELNDCSTLPYLLHQTAEIYFDKEEYEKAIQFIQLEKLYHQKLLTNLAAIQEHWEVKQKAAMAREISGGRTVKSLDNDRIKKLTEICASHSRPNIPGGKISVSAECFYKSECNFISKEKKACKKISAEYNSSFPDRYLNTTRLQTAEYNYASLEVMEDGKEDPIESQVAVPVGECCAREPEMYAAESSLESQIEAVGAKARMHFDVETPHLYSENIMTDESCFQKHAAVPGKNMLTAAETIETECFPEETHVVINAAPCFREEIGSSQHNLKCVGKTTEENEQMSLKYNKTVQFITNGEAPHKHGNHILQKHVRSNSSDCVHEDTRSAQNTSRSEGTVELDGQATKQNHTNVKTEINEEYQLIGSEVEEKIQHSACQMSHELSEGQGDENVEELTNFNHNVITSSQKYDTDELTQINDNSHSLDELAKRIQIEESIHPEGLVSILKKGSPDKEIRQTQHKQPKRRVRFQDPQDTFDQDEGTGDSCLLLVLLCIVTVLFSVLGTALYCTFGDLESSVCRDFTTQMDFYYTQFQQGIAKVKHWLLFS